MLTLETFTLIFNLATISRRSLFYEPLCTTMDFYGINTSIRIAAFTAQIIHESGSLRYVREIASGEAYEGRKDLGNIYPGDGRRYKGRGLIQLTGRNNYQLLSDEFKLDFIKEPQLLELPHWASMSAGWFWHRHGLNLLADKDNFRLITKKINGGYNGWEDRLANYLRIKQLLVA